MQLFKLAFLTTEIIMNMQVGSLIDSKSNANSKGRMLLNYRMDDKSKGLST